MVQTAASPDVLYPDADGQPMADNTQQYRWIVRLVTNLRQLLKDKTAFVAGDLLWYPVKVDSPPVPAQAPDAMVALGRPAGDRGSYKQWEEAGVAPQVVFEIISPSNTATEISQKQAFYDRYGVLEMYFYDPDSFEFLGLTRQSQKERPTLLTPLNLPWTSPILGIRFEMFKDGLALFSPDGELFKDPEELFQERNQAQQERDQAQQKLERAIAKLQDLGIDLDEVE
ncbi:Uma2 family endonuclease [Sphaerothrix gracilis]|uniref:Uma2 family endonuclease n=1 Tax=Sphaerothrix gracilis TaxID=3151835 RepID=UPI0031FC5679